jgi:hypothetical protein
MVSVLFMWFSLTGCGVGHDAEPEKKRDAPDVTLRSFTSNEELEQYRP